MCNKLSWLPEKVCRDSSFNKEHDYILYIRDIFESDFIRDKTYFNGLQVIVNSGVIASNSDTFSHIISQGTGKLIPPDYKEERTLCPKRCERIKWCKAVIENSSDKFVNCWEEKNKNKIRIHIHLRLSELDANEPDYLVVLEKRKTHFLLITTFCLETIRNKEKYKRRYCRNK